MWHKQYAALCQLFTCILGKQGMESLYILPFPSDPSPNNQLQESIMQETLIINLIPSYPKKESVCTNTRDVEIRFYRVFTVIKKFETS